MPLNHCNRRRWVFAQGFGCQTHELRKETTFEGRVECRQSGGEKRGVSKGDELRRGGGLNGCKALVQEGGQWWWVDWQGCGDGWYQTEVPKTGGWGAKAVHDDVAGKADSDRGGVERHDAAGIAELSHRKEGSGLQRGDDVHTSCSQG